MIMQTAERRGENDMNDGKYQPLVDSTDDLPRTLRRAREQQVREQQTREQVAQPTSWDRGQSSPLTPAYGSPEPVNSYQQPYNSSSDASVTVQRFQVPFFSLMGFFIKAVFAAIPAILILVAMLYGLGLAMQTYFPQLIKMKILISFPA
jgi:hypothetical protein